jgi:GNAT superfamily N-acetyltransferase
VIADSSEVQLAVIDSPAESARFGLRVGRLLLAGAGPVDARAIGDAVAAADLDLVVLRYPATAVDVFAKLQGLSDIDVLYADTLMYWEWHHDADRLIAAIGDDLRLVHLAMAHLGDAVRDVFADYPNHYAANPLLDRDAAREGYVEWATTAVASGGAIANALVDADGTLVGFGVVDRTGPIADILLAGIHPTHRGRGNYSRLMAALMRNEVERGGVALAISTQAHHTVVMSTWARLGWVPTRTVTTVHLVRRGLLTEQRNRPST